LNLVYRLAFPKYLFLAMLLPFMMTGCTSQPAVDEQIGSGEPAHQPLGEVYLIRGLFDIFSLGMDDIGQNLKEKGVKASVYSGLSWPNLAQQILDKHKQGDLERPLVISGHSYGADDAIRLARALEQHGVAVDALVLLDPTIPPKIPANVRHCVNIYRSKPSTDWMPWLRGVPVETEGRNTRIVNRDIRISGTDPNLLDEVNHFNIEEHPAIQKMVLEEILDIFRQNGFEISRLDNLSGEE